MVLASHDDGSPRPGATVFTESAALLVAGGDPDQPARARDLTHVISQLDLTLRSTRSRWAIRRLNPGGDERMAPTRVGIKHALEALVRQTSDVVVAAISGVVTGAAGEPALITGPTYRTYPEEATLPLRWIGQRLAAITGPQLVVVVSARPDESAPPVETWVAALAPPDSGHAVFVEAADRAAAIDALSLGLRGAAVDPETGTVTLRSLAEHLARAAPHGRARIEPRPHTIVATAAPSVLGARARGGIAAGGREGDLAAHSAPGSGALSGLLSDLGCPGRRCGRGSFAGGSTSGTLRRVNLHQSSRAWEDLLDARGPAHSGAKVVCDDVQAARLVGVRTDLCGQGR